MFYVIYPDLWKFSIKKWRLARRRRPLWSQWRPHCGFGNFGWNFKILELFSENLKVMKNFKKYWVIISKVGSSWFHRFRKCYWKKKNIFLCFPKQITYLQLFGLKFRFLHNTYILSRHPCLESSNLIVDIGDDESSLPVLQIDLAILWNVIWNMIFMIWKKCQNMLRWSGQNANQKSWDG